MTDFKYDVQRLRLEAKVHRMIKPVTWPAGTGACANLTSGLRNESSIENFSEIPLGIRRFGPWHVGNFEALMRLS